ncbi:hypothetical protein PIB30_055968 [Stylosanthes scabra]|uniref:Uncharacterized protein n=1 Tax=Stylosanthes scabra TaxID=79078 RepID=A0ABU6TJ29_9FABA|nr:hypothetical protein [Stylosanthes scabra]
MRFNDNSNDGRRGSMISPVMGAAPRDATNRIETHCSKFRTGLTDTEVKIEFLLLVGKEIGGCKCCLRAERKIGWTVTLKETNHHCLMVGWQSYPFPNVLGIHNNEGPRGVALTASELTLFLPSVALRDQQLRSSAHFNPQPGHKIFSSLWCIRIGALGAYALAPFSNLGVPPKASRSNAPNLMFFTLFPKPIVLHRILMQLGIGLVVRGPSFALSPFRKGVTRMQPSLKYRLIVENRAQLDELSLRKNKPPQGSGVKPYPQVLGIHNREDSDLTIDSSKHHVTGINSPAVHAWG